MADQKIVFVFTRHFYESYVDMTKLIELSEFETCFVDEVDVSLPMTYILTVINGEWRPHIDNQDDKIRNAHLILWNLERPSGSAGSVGQYGEANRDLIYKRHIDEVWVSDRRLANETQLRYVTLGSHKDLGKPGINKEYDFCHMSYETGRRQGIYSHFQNIGPNCWPPERDEILRQSKFALNIHQDRHPFQEPLRLALFAAYGLPIISESIFDSYPYSEETMIFNAYDGMVNKVKQLLDDDYERWREMGLLARDKMCKEFGFRAMVEEAVNQSLYHWR